MKIATLLFSDQALNCPYCDRLLDGSDQHFAESARHLQEEHKLYCVRVIEQTVQDTDGRSSAPMVAVFGSDESPPLWIKPKRETARKADSRLI